MKCSTYQYEKGRAYFQGLVDVINLPSEMFVKVLNCNVKSLQRIYSANFKGTLLIISKSDPLTFITLREYSKVVWKNFKKVDIQPGVIYGAPSTGKTTLAKSVKAFKVVDTDDIFEKVFEKSKYPLNWRVWTGNDVPFLVRKAVKNEVLDRTNDIVENEKDCLVLTNLTDFRSKAYARFTRPSSIMGDYLHHRDVKSHLYKPTEKWVAPRWLHSYDLRNLDFCFDIVLDYGDYISNYFKL